MQIKKKSDRENNIFQKKYFSKQSKQTKVTHNCAEPDIDL